MPRLPRPTITGMPFHVVHRGVDRAAIRRDESDGVAYLDLLATYASAEGTDLHGYCVMHNHVHLVLTPSRTGALSRTMQRVAHAYAQYFNRRHERTGALWEGRYYAGLIATDGQALACLAYVERNPVRAGLVRRADDYRLSSAASHGEGLHDARLVALPSYSALGTTPADRARAYRLIADALQDAECERIRGATRRGTRIADSRDPRVCRGGARPGAGRPRTPAAQKIKGV
jgi:putative transposase